MTVTPRVLMPATAVILGALMLTGCTGAPPAAQPISSTEAPAPEGTERPVDAGVVAPIDEAGEASQAAAIAAAELAVATFAQSDVDADTWLSQMTPLLSPTGLDAYSGVDPTRITVSDVTGAGVVVEGSTEVSLIVEVPTDAGPYYVTLSRSTTNAKWLADRIRLADAL